MVGSAPGRDKNAVRDRTLILRVLVPGLHTSLNDKINSKKEGDDSTSTLSAGGTAAAASFRSPTGTERNSVADQLSNLDGVTCLPSSLGSTLWHFRCDGATYPARLVNLPCPVEVHKTHDHANYHKAADVGQMLIVYEDEYAMEEAENEKGYKVDGFPTYYQSGLMPPMRRVVQRRFLSRFEERDTKPNPPPQSEVKEVEKEIQGLISKFSSSKGKQKRGGGGASSMSGKAKVVEEVEEEIVDYEPWMGNGGVFTIDDAKAHPEWFLTRAEMREIDAAKKAQAAVEEEERRKEREEAAAEAARVEREKAEKAERKRKKKDKKKKKEERQQQQQQQQQQADDRRPSPSSSGGEVASSPTAVTSGGAQEGEVMDDVTAAAMAINEGEGDVEMLLGDDMFDFAGEDITDLL